jgi:hypothetical protein
MINYTPKGVEAGVLARRAGVVVQPHFGLWIAFLDDPSDAQVGVFGERIAGRTAIVVSNRGHASQRVGHPADSPVTIEREGPFA